jgi:hypothetical protein
MLPACVCLRVQTSFLSIFENAWTGIFFPASRFFVSLLSSFHRLHHTTTTLV